MAWQDNGTVCHRRLSRIIHMMLMHGRLDDLYLILAQIVRISTINHLSQRSKVFERISNTGTSALH